LPDAALVFHDRACASVSRKAAEASSVFGRADNPMAVAGRRRRSSQDEPRSCEHCELNRPSTGEKMAVDFVLRLPCEVRRNIPEQKLVSMVRHVAIAEFAFGKFKQAHPEYDNKTIAEQCTVQIGVNGPDGTARETPVTIAELFQMVAPLTPLREYCKPCRANVADRNFGCIAKINYPMSASMARRSMRCAPAPACSRRRHRHSAPGAEYSID
jgi:hypothetical protein